MGGNTRLINRTGIRKGVYKIPLVEVGGNGNKAYVGVTTRRLSKRIEEHKKDIEKANITTSLAQEAYANDIDVQWKKAEIIRRIPPHMQPTIMESLEIIKRKEKELLINDKLAWEPSDVWKYALRRQQS